MIRVRCLIYIFHRVDSDRSCFLTVCVWHLGHAYTQVRAMQEDSREGEGKTVDWGCHHSRCGLSDRGRMRLRQAKDGRMLRNRLTAGESPRRKSTNRHPQASSEHP